MSDQHKQDNGLHSGRRDFFQLMSAAGVLAGAGVASAQAQTATDPHVTTQPAPLPSPDQTTSDILVEPLIA